MKQQQRDYGGDGPAGSQPLLTPTAASGSLFNYGQRRWTDVSWLVAYVLVLLGSISGGIYAFVNRNKKFFELTAPDHLNDPSSCPPPKEGRQLLEEGLVSPGGADGQWRFDALLSHGAVWLSLTVAGSLALAAIFLVLLRFSARGLVGCAIALQVALPAFGAGAAFANDAPAGGVSLLLLAGLLGLLFVVWREQVQLVTQLLGLAGEALLKNLGLVGVALGLQLGLVVAAAPLLVGIAVSLANGNVAYNEARDDSKAPANSTTAGGDVAPCVDEMGNPVMCCTWQVDSWVPMYLPLVILALLWTVFLAFEIKVFTVSGTVAQWYFGPVADTSRQGGGSRALLSLGHALGPSLGSLCLGSAVLTLMSLLRSAMQKAREESGRNIFLWLVASVLSFIYAVIEYLTKFATVRMAMTGERFFHAGRNVVDLLARNAMDTLGVWWLPPLILQNCALVAAASWGFGMWATGKLNFGDVESGPPSAVALGVAAFVCGWAVLSFFCALLLNVVDALFVCYAMDRDLRTCTLVQVHEVVSKLPSVGPLIEEPDGSYAYGNPQRV